MIVLETERLRLRPLKSTDAPAVQQLAGDADVALMTQSMPYPYPDGAAQEWIEIANIEIRMGRGYTFAVTCKPDQTFVGAMGIHLTGRTSDRAAKLAFWMGKPFWNQGYALEAARCVMEFGFKNMEVQRIYATCFGHDDRARQTLEAVGMVHEVTLREHILRDGVFHDRVYYAILRDEYDRRDS